MSRVTTLFRCSFVLGALAAAGCAGADGSTDPMALDETIEFDVNEQGIVDPFKVEEDSFGFANMFTNTPIPGLDIKTAGLCGGMVYAALDYWSANKTIPVQDYPPNAAQPLRHWINQRQADSMLATATDWLTLSLMTKDAMFKFGATRANVDFMTSAIAANRPLPVGLHQTEGKQDHQVLVVGYELGAYSAAWGGYPNLKLKVYDPNHPKELRTLQADTANKYWYDPAEPSSTRHHWAGFFFDDGYVAANPPTITTPTTGLALKFMTGGGDGDLLGTTNLNVILTMKDNSTKTYPWVNANGQWGTGSEEWVALSLANPRDVKSVTLQIPAPSLDAWNLDQLGIYNISSSVLSTPRLWRSGAPLVRLGDLFQTTQVNFELPKTLIHAPNGDFAKSHEDFFAGYKSWDGTYWCASIYGNTFLHAPNCDWNQAHSDNWMAYVTNGQNWAATINNKTFTHTLNGVSHQDTILSYETGGGAKWTMKVK